MTQLLQVLVIAQLLLSRTHLCAHAENDPLPRVLYVTPHSNIPCPEIPCLTLSQYCWIKIHTLEMTQNFVFFLEFTD